MVLKGTDSAYIVKVVLTAAGLITSEDVLVPGACGIAT